MHHFSRILRLSSLDLSSVLSTALNSYFRHLNNHSKYGRPKVLKSVIYAPRSLPTVSIKKNSKVLFCDQRIQFCTVFVFFRDFLQLLKAWTSVWSYRKNQWHPQSGVFSGVGGCGGLMRPFGCLFMSYCALWGKTFVVRRKVWQHHWSNFAFATINTLCIAKGSMILICSRLLHNRASKVICLSGKNVLFVGWAGD